jgi:hypothetical protein
MSSTHRHPIISVMRQKKKKNIRAPPPLRHRRPFCRHLGERRRRVMYTCVLRLLFRVEREVEDQEGAGTTLYSRTSATRRLGKTFLFFCL